MTTFHVQLRSAMTRRNATRADVYHAVGTTSSSVKRWMDGTIYPDHDFVVAMAEFLHWPSLVAISIADRSGTCEACGKPTMGTRGPTPPRYCSDRCIRRTRDRASHDRKQVQKAGLWKRRAEEAEEAIARMCRTCTLGEAICRDETCDLRDVSPLPFIPLSRVRAA
jgi:hypothetical protein